MRVYVVYLIMLSGREGVVSVFPRAKLCMSRPQDHGTLICRVSSQTVERKQSVESDIIIGVIDTGVWPELESFTDQGFGPPPKKWNGFCKGGSNFTCNK